MLKTIIIAAAALLLAGCGSSGGGGGGAPAPAAVSIPHGWDQLDSGIPYGIHRYEGTGVNDGVPPDNPEYSSTFTMHVNFIGGYGHAVERGVIYDGSPQSLEYQIDRINVFTGEFYGEKESPDRHARLIRGHFEQRAVRGDMGFRSQGQYGLVDTYYRHFSGTCADCPQ